MSYLGHYTITCACDHPSHKGKGNDRPMATFYGVNKKAAENEAAKAGWSLTTKTQSALCRDCFVIN